MSLVHLRSTAVALCALACLHAIAQGTPAEITDAQIAQMRAAMEPGCVARGRAQGAPEHDVVSFCICMTKVFDANVPQETWRQMAWLGTQQKNEEALQRLNSYLPLLKSCKDHEAD